MRMTKKQDHVLNVVVVYAGMAMSGYVPTVITQKKTKSEYNISEDFFLKNSTDFSLSSKLYATYGCSYHHFYTVWSLFRKKDH